MRFFRMIVLHGYHNAGEIVARLRTMFIYFGNVPKYKHISRGLKGMLVKFLGWIYNTPSLCLMVSTGSVK